MKLKVLGYVIHKSNNSGNLIIKSEVETRMNEVVYDKKGRKIGNIFDVFGPVNSPFVSVKIEKETRYKKGKPLFICERFNRKQK